MTADDLVPLHSFEAEMSVLGSMIMDGSAARSVAVLMSGRDFYRPAHKEIFGALVKLAAQSKPIDLVTLKNELLRREKLFEVGGEDYLIQIAEFVPSSSNALHYAEIVIEKALLRELEHVGRDVIGLTRELGETSADLRLAKAHKLLTEVRDRYWGRRPGRILSTTVFGDSYQFPVTQHLMAPYIVRGKPILWDADGGTHKTGSLVAIAAWLSRGVNPLTLEEMEPVRTLYFHKGEDQSEELEAIYRANGGVKGMIEYIDRLDLVLDASGIELIGNTIVDRNAGNMVLDAFFYFLPGNVRSTNDNLPAMAVMQPYCAMLASTGAAAVDIRHTTKLTVDKEASQRGMGSVQFRNSHRGQLAARYDPNDESENKRVIVTDEKGSLLNERGKPFAFRRIGLEIQFVIGEVENPFISPEKEMYQKRDRGVRPATKLEECKVWLISHLASAAVRRDAVIERAADAGYKQRMVDEAKSSLELSTRRQPRPDGEKGTPHVWWAMPEYDWTKLENSWDPFADDEPAPAATAEAYDPYADE